jgi:alpha-L-fucosidase
VSRTRWRKTPRIHGAILQLAAALALSGNGISVPRTYGAALAADFPAPNPVEVVPSARQLAWQKREVQALVHFGMNTFTGHGWGSGLESPTTFNPTNVDCAQWVQVAQSFGAKSITFTCKHHDGFCLWPSAFTEHSVRSSPWKNGQGDVVRELAEACHRAGLEFGIYVSMADLHQPDYGRNSQKYNDYFCNQLSELLTNYGEICQVFFDGAQPSRGHQAYDLPRYYRLIRDLQPNAVISMHGPDVRWVGNELGRAREFEWSVIPLPVPAEEFNWPNMKADDLGSRDRLRGARYLHWYPVAADVPLRHTWFWHPGAESTLKSLPDLLAIYETSVGRNGIMQLNLSPDTSGRIPEADMKRCQEFGTALATLFATNLLEQPGVCGPLIAQADGSLTETISLKSPRSIHYLVLHEDITKGQRVEAFDVIATLEPAGQQTFSGTTIGWKRMLNFKGIPVRELLLHVRETRAPPFITVSAF